MYCFEANFPDGLILSESDFLSELYIEELHSYKEKNTIQIIIDIFIDIIFHKKSNQNVIPVL